MPCRKPVLPLVLLAPRLLVDRRLVRNPNDEYERDHERDGKDDAKNFDEIHRSAPTFKGVDTWGCVI